MAMCEPVQILRDEDCLRYQILRRAIRHRVHRRTFQAMAAMDAHSSPAMAGQEATCSRAARRSAVSLRIVADEQGPPSSRLKAEATARALCRRHRERLRARTKRSDHSDS